MKSAVSEVYSHFDMNASVQEDSWGRDWKKRTHLESSLLLPNAEQNLYFNKNSSVSVPSLQGATGPTLMGRMERKKKKKQQKREKTRTFSA